MKIQTGIIIFILFILTSVFYFAWVGNQLAARSYLPGAFWPFN